MVKHFSTSFHTQQIHLFTSFCNNWKAYNIHGVLAQIYIYIYIDFDIHVCVTVEATGCSKVYKLWPWYNLNRDDIIPKSFSIKIEGKEFILY